MNMSIAFPNLGLYFDNVGKSFTIFGFEIAYYGVAIGVGLLLGIWFSLREARRLGLDEDKVFNMVILAVIAGIIGARVYYVAFKWEYYQEHLSEILNYRQGGIAIYGAIIGGLLAIIVYTRVRKLPLRKVVDACCMGVLIGQICGRWGNFFNREAFGDYTDSLFAMRLPLSAVRSGDITDNIRAHMSGGYLQVHPTFLYESLWNLLLFLILLRVRKRKKFDGQIFLMYLFGYGIGRFWIEGLRTDQLLLPVVGLPVSQVLSACLVICSFVLLLAGSRKCASVQPLDAVQSADMAKPQRTGAHRSALQRNRLQGRHSRRSMQRAGVRCRRYSRHFYGESGAQYRKRLHRENRRLRSR